MNTYSLTHPLPPLDIFIGHDEKEQDAFDVCCYSIEEKCKITPRKLSSKNIPSYSRKVPNEIQSTDFTFTRFLVPSLMDYKGYGLYVDSDFLFLKNPLDILKSVNIEDNSIAVWVVQHPSYIPKSSIKMNNLPQHQMYRKNWASLMLFNNAHPAVKGALTSKNINTNPRGRDFHEFLWCDTDMIGSIPLEWNCLDGYYHLSDPAAIHYTDGGPWHGNGNTNYAHLWKAAYQSMRRNQKTP